MGPNPATVHVTVGRSDDHVNAPGNPTKWPMPHRRHHSLSARHSTAATVDSNSSCSARVTCRNNNNRLQNNLHHSRHAGRLHNVSWFDNTSAFARTRAHARAHRHTRTFWCTPLMVAAAFLRMRRHSKVVPFESKVSLLLQRCRGMPVAW